MNAETPEQVERFCRDYAVQRKAEGRAFAGPDLLSLPYLKNGPLVQEWSVRARTFNALLEKVVKPMAGRSRRALRLLDLGAGNGWFSFRMACEGHDCVAIDLRNDEVDGLAAGDELARQQHFDRRVAPFDRLPIGDGEADIAVFNAALHYSTDLQTTLREAARCLRPGGVIAILDSPFYATEQEGLAMIAERSEWAEVVFADRAEGLFSMPHIDFLTADRLANASTTLGLAWRRHRVLYPLWYELRPIKAWIRGDRKPSRFDLWTGQIDDRPSVGGAVR